MRTTLALLLLIAAAPALAQETGASQQGDSGTKKKQVIRLDALTVEGKIQKPTAFYVLPRRNLNFEDLNKPESFVPKVVQTVDKQPF